MVNRETFIEVTISESAPERRAFFVEVFGTATVPVTGLLPQMCKLPRHTEPQECFLLDLAKLGAEQRRRLCAHLADKFGGTEAEVDSILDAEGLPILASDCTLATNLTWFL